MICPKCGNEGTKNSALGKEFYYCRTCKEEIGLTAVSPAEPEQEPFDFFFSNGPAHKFSVGDMVRCTDVKLANRFSTIPGPIIKLGYVYGVVSMTRYMSNNGWSNVLTLTDGLFQFQALEAAFERVSSGPRGSSPATTNPPPSVWMTSYPGNWMSNPELKAQWLADKDWT